MGSTPQQTVAVELSEEVTRPAAVVRGTAPTAELPAFLEHAFTAVLRTLADQQLEPVGPPFACYRIAGERFDVEAGFPATGPVRAAGDVVPTELPGGTTATALHRGSYESLGATYAAVGTWLAEHGYALSGDPWESYLDEPDVPSPRTLVSFPCRRR